MITHCKNPEGENLINPRSASTSPSNRKQTDLITI